MSKPGYALLQDVIMDADFPDLDLALRRGRHVDREDAAWYALLHDGQEQLEQFYRRYGCELIHKTDGYFYLLPTGDKISRKQLSASDMLVGQALALLYLDPANVERGGVIAHEDLVAQLSSVLGTDALIAAFNPGVGAGKKKKYDERIAQRNVRNRVAESVRRLASMGFVDSTEDERVRLRPALMRFAEPVRGLSEPAEALAKLVAQGEVALEQEAGEELEAVDAADGGDVMEAAPESPLAADGEPASGITTRLGVAQQVSEAAEVAAERGASGAEGAVEVWPAAEVRPAADGGTLLPRGAIVGTDVVPLSDASVGEVSDLDRASGMVGPEVDVALGGELETEDVSSDLAFESAAPASFAEAVGGSASSEAEGPGAELESVALDAAFAGAGVEHGATYPSDAEAQALNDSEDTSADPSAAQVSANESPSAPQPVAAERVHPMDQDLDWADILPDPQEPG